MLLNDVQNNWTSLQTMLDDQLHHQLSRRQKQLLKRRRPYAKYQRKQNYAYAFLKSKPKTCGDLEKPPFERQDYKSRRGQKMYTSDYLKPQGKLGQPRRSFG
jgi:hypothetical protein